MTQLPVPGLAVGSEKSSVFFSTSPLAEPAVCEPCSARGSVSSLPPLPPAPVSPALAALLLFSSVSLDSPAPARGVPGQLGGPATLCPGCRCCCGVAGCRDSTREASRAWASSQSSSTVMLQLFRVLKGMEGARKGLWRPVVLCQK